MDAFDVSGFLDQKITNKNGRPGWERKFFGFRPEEACLCTLRDKDESQETIHIGEECTLIPWSSNSGAEVGFDITFPTGEVLSFKALDFVSCNEWTQKISKIMNPYKKSESKRPNSCLGPNHEPTPSSCTTQPNKSFSIEGGMTSNSNVVSTYGFNTIDNISAIKPVSTNSTNKISPDSETDDKGSDFKRQYKPTVSSTDQYLQEKLKGQRWETLFGDFDKSSPSLPSKDPVTDLMLLNGLTDSPNPAAITSSSPHSYSTSNSPSSHQPSHLTPNTVVSPSTVLPDPLAQTPLQDSHISTPVPVTIPHLTGQAKSSVLSMGTASPLIPRHYLTGQLEGREVEGRGQIPGATPTSPSSLAALFPLLSADRGALAGTANKQLNPSQIGSLDGRVLGGLGGAGSGDGHQYLEGAVREWEERLRKEREFDRQLGRLLDIDKDKQNSRMFTLQEQLQHVTDQKEQVVERLEAAELKATSLSEKLAALTEEHRQLRASHSLAAECWQRERELLRQETEKRISQLLADREQMVRTLEEQARLRLDDVSARCERSVTEVENYVAVRVRKEMEVEMKQTIASMQKKCTVDIEEALCVQRNQHAEELEGLRRVFIGREQETLEDLKKLEQLHSERVGRLEAEKQQLLGRIVHMEERLLQAREETVEEMSTLKQRFEDQLLQLQSQSELGERLKKDLQRAHEEVQSARSREASFKAQLSNVLEEYRIKQGEYVETQRKSSQYEATVRQLTSLCQEERLRCTALLAELNISRDEVAMLEHELRRQQEECWAVTQALNKAETLVYGKSFSISQPRETVYRQSDDRDDLKSSGVVDKPTKAADHSRARRVTGAMSIHSSRARKGSLR